MKQHSVLLWVIVGVWHLSLAPSAQRCLAQGTAPSHSSATSITPPEHHFAAALPFCNTYLGSLPVGSEREALRDTLQQLQLQHRLVGDLKGQLRYKRAPTATEGEEAALQKAHRTPHTEQELQQQLGKVEVEAARWQQQLDGSVQALKGQGLLHAEVTEIILSSCLMGRLNPRLYPGRPQISFMLQYFQRPWMIAPILAALRSCNSVQSELLVNVDSAEDHQAWAEFAHNSSGYVVPVFSANVHEIRAYNRLAALARGKVVVVLQDDLEPPSGCEWQSNVVALFNALPRLAALGLKSYRFNTRRDNNVTGRDVFFTEPSTGLPMQYTQMVDFAPMAILRAAFKHVGGLDEGLSEPGMCGIYSDFELSVRFWSAGWHVGYHPVTGTKPDHSGVPSGTHKPESEARCWRRQMGLSGSVHMERWVGPTRPSLLQEALAVAVRNLNLHTLQRIPGKHCPFSPAFGGCDVQWQGADQGL